MDEDHSITHFRFYETRCHAAAWCIIWMVGTLVLLSENKINMNKHQLLPWILF